MTALKLKNEVLRLITDMDDPEQLEKVKCFIQSDVIQTKEAILEDFKEGLKESFKQIKLYEEGKLELKTAKEFLDEL